MQAVLRVSNKVTLQQTWFNAERSRKPQSFAAVAAEAHAFDATGGGATCDFCAWQQFTAQDTWGRWAGAAVLWLGAWWRGLGTAQGQAAGCGAGAQPAGPAPDGTWSTGMAGGACRVEGPHAVSASNAFKYCNPAQGAHTSWTMGGAWIPATHPQRHVPGTRLHRPPTAPQLPPARARRRGPVQAPRPAAVLPGAAAGPGGCLPPLVPARGGRPGGAGRAPGPAPPPPAPALRVELPAARRRQPGGARGAGLAQRCALPPCDAADRGGALLLRGRCSPARSPASPPTALCPRCRCPRSSTATPR